MRFFVCCLSASVGVCGFNHKTILLLPVFVCRWFQENASRSAAEELLKHKDVGEFVIRGCQSTPGEFSISVRWEKENKSTVLSSVCLDTDDKKPHTSQGDRTVTAACQQRTLELRWFGPRSHD